MKSLHVATMQLHMAIVNPYLFARHELVNFVLQPSRGDARALRVGRCHNCPVLDADLEHGRSEVGVPSQSREKGCDSSGGRRGTVETVDNNNSNDKLKAKNTHIWSHSTRVHPRAERMTSHKSISLRASPTHWLTRRVSASRRLQACPAAPSAWLPALKAARALSENRTVPWPEIGRIWEKSQQCIGMGHGSRHKNSPLASKYTPTSYLAALWWRCLTPVLAHCTGTLSVFVMYCVEAPLA